MAENKKRKSKTTDESNLSKEYLDFINEQPPELVCKNLSILHEAAIKINKQLEDGDYINENDLIAIIHRVTRVHKNKSFGYFSSEDIFGEAWVICIDQISKFNPKKMKGSSTVNSIERFLNTTTKNRLHNFYRDSYSSINPYIREKKLNIINAIGFDDIDDRKELNTQYYEEGFGEDLLMSELFDFIKERLDEDSLNIMYDLMNDENVSVYYKSKLKQDIDAILQEWREFHGEE